MAQEVLPLDAQHFPLLALLDEDAREKLVRAAEERMLAADVPALAEGEMAEGLFFVARGLLRVAKRMGSEVFEVATLTPGEIFGEGSILDDAPAAAEVRTVEACTLYLVPREVAQEILAAHPRFRRGLAQLSDRRKAATAIAISPVFSKLPMAVREVALFNAAVLHAPAGATLTEEGGMGDEAVYLILSGEAEASMRHPARPGQRIVFARLSDGDEFGEISALFGKPQAATIIARTPMRLLAIPAEMVRAWSERYPEFRYALYARIQRKLQHALDAVRKIAGKDISSTISGIDLDALSG